MPNVRQLKMVHHQKLSDIKYKKMRICDRRKKNCPVNGKYPKKTLIFKTTVKTKNQTQLYVGSTRLSFKDCFKILTYSFRHEKYCKAATLSQYIQKLKKKKKLQSLFGNIHKN